MDLTVQANLGCQLLLHTHYLGLQVVEVELPCIVPVRVISYFEWGSALPKYHLRGVLVPHCLHCPRILKLLVNLLKYLSYTTTTIRLLHDSYERLDTLHLDLKQPKAVRSPERRDDLRKVLPLPVGIRAPKLVLRLAAKELVFFVVSI